MADSLTYSTDGNPEEADSQQEFFARMLDRYQRAVKADIENRLAATDDLRFRAGVQWPANLQKQREDSYRPVLTINQIPQFCRAVTGEIRQNTPSIKVKTAKLDPWPGESQDQRDLRSKALADVYSGLIRNIEQQSKARYVYSQGADGAVSAGWGAWRITTELPDDSVDEQEIMIKAIPDALSVVWDPLATELDRSDAKYCFVHYRLPKAAFREAYPHASTVDFDLRSDDVDAQNLRYWFDGEGVRVAEYWVHEPTTKLICKLQDGSVIDCTDLDEQALMAQKPFMKNGKPFTREVKTTKVVCYIVSGKEILSEPTEWAGKHIPIIHVPGEEVWVGENRVMHGITRFLKDPQRVKNYMRSCSAEVVGEQPKMPFLLTPHMIAGYEQDWQTVGSNGKPYLLWNPDPEQPGLTPQRINPPVQSTGLAEEAQQSDLDMHQVSGIYPSSLGAQGQESSGVAIRTREKQGDTGTYIYIDNVGLAVARTGELLVDLIPRIYDTDREIRVLGEDGQHQMVPINREVVVRGPNGPETRKLFDLSAGKFDVSVTTGPSYANRSEEASQGILQLIQAFPQAAPVLADVVANLQDWPDREKVVERLQALLPPQLQPQQKGPDGRPLPPPPPPPTPEEIQAQAKAQAQQQQMQMDAQQQQHDQQLEMAQAQHKAALAELEFNSKQALVEKEFQLQVWIAQQTQILEREKISAQIGMQQEAADRKAIIDGTPNVMKGQEQITQTGQELGHLLKSLIKVHSAPTKILRDPANNNTVIGSQKDISPEDLAALHPAVHGMTKPQMAQRDASGNITGTAPQPMAAAE